MHWERMRGVSEVDRHKMWKEYVTAELSHHHIHEEFRVNPISYQHARGIPDPISKRGKRFLDRESALLEALTRRLGPRAAGLLTNNHDDSDHAISDRCISCPPVLPSLHTKSPPHHELPVAAAPSQPSPREGAAVPKKKKKDRGLPPLAAPDSPLIAAAAPPDEGCAAGDHHKARFLPPVLTPQPSKGATTLPPLQPQPSALSQQQSPASSTSSCSGILTSPRLSPFDNRDVKQTLTTINNRPIDKYKYPMTTAQEFGWLSTPRIGETPEPLDTRFRFPLRSCEITKLQAAYQHSAANGATLSKSQKWGK